jgi:nucleoside-diphosphate-sugar epimerase
MLIFCGEASESASEIINHKESVHFLSGLTNVITAAKYAGVKRFIYLSSLEVCEGDAEAVTEEYSEVMPLGAKAKTYFQGEKLCEFYREKDVFEVGIIRTPEIFGSFGDMIVGGNVVEKFIQEANKMQGISVNPNKSHYLVELNDAVEACYEVAFKCEWNQPIPFHVPGTFYTEKEIALLIKDEMGEKVQIIEKPTEILCKRKFGTSRLEQRGFVLRNKLENTIGEICQVISENLRVEERKKRRHSDLSHFILAIVENVVLFFAAYFLTMLTKDNWIGEVVNFYLIYVIIIAVVHGTTQTLLATFLSVIGEFFSILSAEGVGGILGEFGPYIWVLQLLVAGMLVAYMRDKYKLGLRDVSEDNRYLQIELDEIKEINESNVYIKEVYEKNWLTIKTVCPDFMK